MVTMELERIKVGKLQDQNVKDEYVERLKDSMSEIKQHECLEFDELWKVTKSVLEDETKKILPVAHSPVIISFLSINPSSVIYLIPTREAGNALVTPQGLRVFMDGGDHLPTL
ncbi:hypothetical protein EVAR_3236_1 [Eumeta japonica]|uniref:Uncharacterized protein n=1 Tax=Eumeta variegata TaxID=151549 RepID=A0A4C1SXR5_EUMVA|nr:hypothetical protein EVAR_3236_1 [Eumeta japonica]